MHHSYWQEIYKDREMASSRDLFWTNSREYLHEQPGECPQFNDISHYINFTCEREEKNKLPFFDVLLERNEVRNLEQRVFRK